LCLKEKNRVRYLPVDNKEGIKSNREVKMKKSKEIMELSKEVGKERLYNEVYKERELRNFEGE